MEAGCQNNIFIWKIPGWHKTICQIPHGVPPNLLPKKFQLGSCVYGHPLANSQ
jgi:hypothetical protein